MRLFVAVDLKDDLREEIEKVLRIFREFRGIKPVEKENLHITLMFLGEVPDRKVDMVKEKLRGIKLEPFKIRLKGLGNFNYRVFWIGVLEGKDLLSILAKEVENSLKKIGFKRDKEFVAHATVARVKRLNPNDRIKLEKSLESFKDYDFGEMIVDCFKLKKSTLTSKGPIYEDLEIYSFR